MTALIIGTVLALAALMYVLYPLLYGSPTLFVQSEPGVCPGCGAKTESGAAFCSECGNPLV